MEEKKKYFLSKPEDTWLAGNLSGKGWTETTLSDRTEEQKITWGKKWSLSKPEDNWLKET